MPEGPATHGAAADGPPAAEAPAGSPWPPPLPPVDVAADDEALARVEQVSAAGPFRPAWDSLVGYQVPDWYRDAKFGIFVHWGAYSVPAFGNEWYPRTMYKEGTPEHAHHLRTYGEAFGYKDFLPMFTADRFDADAWASLFAAAGAQFVVPVAEHHDGFAMYETSRSRWKAPQLGPRRDVIGELADAVRRRWMVFGLSSHRAEHWWFMGAGGPGTDVHDPAFADFYGPASRQDAPPNEQFLQDWLLRTTELVDRYRPQLVWFDWWVEQPAFEPYLRTFASYYNEAARWRRGVVVNYKWDAFAPGAAVYDVERGGMADQRPDVWQNDTSVSRTSWGWVEGHDWKSVADLVAELVDVVAKNGVLLLNVGPKPDGTIADEEAALLRGLGRWLAVHGEAVYGTRPWRVAGEGPTEQVEGSFTDGTPVSFGSRDLRFTSRSDVTGSYVYATALGWPGEGRLRIRSFGRGAGLLAPRVAALSVLGHAGPVEWTLTDDALEVLLPRERPSEHGVTVKLRLERPAPARRTDQFH